MSLLVLGTVAFDSIETPFGKADHIIGGAGTYIAWAGSMFYNDIKLVSVIGDDFPQEELDLLKARGVNMDALELREGEKSFYWSGKYNLDLNSRDTLATELNVLEDYNPVLPDSCKNPQYLMLGNFAPAVQMSIIEQIPTRPELVVMDTMNFWMDIAMDDLKKVLKKIDVLTINDEEARQLSGEYSLVKAANVIREMGPKYLVIKKGEHGALLFHEEGMFYVPALPLEEVFDPTGAGDSFAGGFLGYLAKKGDFSFTNMKRALVYGSAIASFCVEEFGPNKLKKLDDQMVKDRINEFLQLMTIEREKADLL